MDLTLPPGARFQAALDQEFPLQIVGTVNAYCAIMAEKVGFKALYLSGGGVANISYGLPDLGITNLQNVLEDARRIISVTELPLLVDIDTGFGGALNIAHTIRECIRTGIAAVHIEDQVAQKRCGHRPGKVLVDTAEMLDRIKAAVDARTDAHFKIMARTDAFAVEGLERAIERACAYVSAGADLIFAEALTDLSQYTPFCKAVKAPVLANMTEFGKTELYKSDALAQVGIKMVLYPRSAERAMSAAALKVFEIIRERGTQAEALLSMQTRETLYSFLNYNALEKQIKPSSSP